MHDRRDGSVLCGAEVRAALPAGAGPDCEAALHEAFEKAANAAAKSISGRLELVLL